MRPQLSSVPKGCNGIDGALAVREHQREDRCRLRPKPTRLISVTLLG
jgi:hypothetical protein